MVRFLLIFFAIVIPFLIFGDTVVMKDGRVLKGTIVEEGGGTVKLRTSGGDITLMRDEIERIEKDMSLKEEYEKRRKELGEKDAEGHYQLAQWCKKNGLREEAEKELEKVIAIDPEHEGARREAGYTKIDGKWVKEEEYMREQGYVKKDGTWVKKEEAEDAKKREEEARKRREEAEKKKIEEKVSAAEEAKQKEYEGVPWDSRHRISSEHFNLECNCPRKVAEYYSWLLEALYDKYTEILGQFRPMNRKCDIYIFRNYEEFLQMTRRPQGVGGFYIPGQFKLYAYHGVFGMTGDTSAVLAHECTHLFQDLIGLFGGGGMGGMGGISAPIWLIEGLAVVMEAADINKKTGKIKIQGVSRDRLMALQESVRTNKKIPLRQLIGTPHAQYGALHYAYGGMFTYWLLTEAGMKGQQVYVDYINYVKGGVGRGRQVRPVEDLEELTKKHLGKSIEEVEEVWLKWVMKQKLEPLGKMKGTVFVSEELEFQIAPPKGWSVAPVSKMEAAEAVVFLKDTLKARISVIGVGNMMNHDLDKYLVEHKKAVDEAIKNGDITDYKLISEGRIKLCGLDAYEKIYDCASPKSNICTELRRRARVYLVTTEYVYIIGVMAPEEKFEEAYKSFKEALETFKPLAK
ncbi:MAG: hypothetical protein N2234_05650 [Planctomycetota bacterium]|nr:hypothetical protein [Planctomycetota bacterium]